MGRKNGSDGIQGSLLCVGPINLNRATKQASTAYCTALLLDEKEFDALYMLAAHEGTYLTFEQIYRALWAQPPDGVDGRDAARKGLNKITRQVSEAGKGFMWIDYVPGRGYAFMTRWGHNRQTWMPRDSGNED